MTWFHIWEYTERLLVADEGITVENLQLNFNGCRNACDRNSNCKSFSHGGVDCFLKKKCVRVDDVEHVSGASLDMKTYYKNCSGSFTFDIFDSSPPKFWNIFIVLEFSTIRNSP